MSWFKNYWLEIDWLLLLSPLLLTSIGILSMYSNSSSSIYLAQLFFLCLGILIVYVLIRFDLKILLNYSYIFYLSFLIVTAGTLLFGVTRNGSTSWYEIFGYTLQPSEFLKLFFILALTRFFSFRTYQTLWTVLQSMLYFLLPVLVVLYLQKDLGTAIVFLIIFLSIISILYFSYSERKRLLLFFILGGMTLIVSAYLLIQNYQLNRLAVFPDHFQLKLNHHADIGYQVDQSLVAIGSAGWWGKGLSYGTQNQLGFLPEKHNDFIFASIVEEMGLSSAMLIFFLYGIIAWRLFLIAKKSEYIITDLLMAGILGLLLYQILRNIGMNLGLVPVTGISLPFISYGGSFLLTSYALIGLAESLLLRYKKSFS